MIKEIIRPVVWPVKSTVKTIWVCRHMFYHGLIGLVYAWIWREIWSQFNPRFFLFSLFGSLIVDIDHLLYFFFYGKHDPYSLQVKEFLRRGKVRTLFSFWGSNHKSNTNLMSHNIYVVGLLLLISILSFFIEFETGVILFGAMMLHLVFDLLDDFLILGELNPNWKRWGRKSS